MNFDDPHFKSGFWRWFDNIPPSERKSLKNIMLIWQSYFSTINISVRVLIL
jgi:antibiotic biosynthesis monooxygenase (ABM) superfamily enzyme